VLREKLASTNERCVALQAELLASTVDTGQLAALAKPTLIGQRRIPGLKLHDDRVIRALETLLHPGAFAPDWTTRELHTRVLARHQLADADYLLSQLRYDLAKLRAKGLVERLGTSRRYRLTALGLKLGVLLVKLRTRLLGPLATLITDFSTRRLPLHTTPSTLRCAKSTPLSITSASPSASNTWRKQNFHSIISKGLVLDSGNPGPG